MTKTIMLILVGKRTETALRVQTILTEFGCCIKTRLGIHEGAEGKCSNAGLIMLDLVGDAAQQKALEKNLEAVDGVRVKRVEMTM